ncbi:hypothetical protein BC939DRAFT_1497 [Gamsiella multidivaricata]|uniref:uncharacterized protein n=1 Tax=Gamsiella multidivaricata TaxID=101098 RepID=UPI002220BA0D|nr:uncharacterized protein BC939DRAFT_1497 [Gamsiella multidivaricata]KAI7832578.1 hypothetical protein BC939DRAFT_1497 [Gamsiella multidivaricata]
MLTMASHYVETTTKAGVNDCYVLNAGFSVWAMDWCPLPSYDRNNEAGNKSYVAIGGFPDTAENCIKRDQLYPLGKQDAHPNMIQLWSMNCKTNDQGELRGAPSAYLDMCILHPYGAVLDLKWCPTGGWMETDTESMEPGDLTRLGILAASFSDGSIRIFSVPEPSSIRGHKGTEIPEGSTPETLYIRYPEPYATIRLGDVSFMSISWGTAERLAAGVTNGTIAIWDMKTMLNQSKETLAEKDSEYLDPIYLPQVHDVCVRSIDWVRSCDAESVPWVVVTSGYDGRVRYTDLHDCFTQIDIKTILGVPMTSICIPWAEATIYVDVDFGAKIDQLYRETHGFRLFNAKGTIWDFSYSDYQPFLAAAVSDGRVKIANPAYKVKRGYGMVQNHIYQLEEVAGDVQNGLGEAEQREEEVDTENISVFRYNEGEEKEYLSKTDGFLNFYGANVAIQKWSRCYHSAAWLASGSAGGIVRIDNTMLRKEEGGYGNKIKYAPEPYILKKRMALGKVDELGRRLNSDGQPVKLGRPKTGTTKETGGPASRRALPKNTRSKSKVNQNDSSDQEEGDDHTRGDTNAKDVSGSQPGSSVSSAEKRAIRQSTRLAPIFTRTLSTTTTTNSVDVDVAADVSMDGEQAESSSQQASSSSKPPSDAPAPPTPSEPVPPKKPRGRPRKHPAPTAAAETASSSQNILSVMKPSVVSLASSTVATAPATTESGVEANVDKDETSQAAPDFEMQGGEEEAALSTTIATSVERAKKTKVAAAKGKRAANAKPPSEEVSVEENQQAEESSQPLGSSSRASSVTPDSPRKKRGPYKTKKRVEELNKQNRSLKDFWGGAAGKSKD